MVYELLGTIHRIDILPGFAQLGDPDPVQHIRHARPAQVEAFPGVDPDLVSCELYL